MEEEVGVDTTIHDFFKSKPVFRMCLLQHVNTLYVNIVLL